MKILHVISSLEVGGAQKLVSDLLPMFSSRGLEVELLVFQDVENNLSKKIKEAGINIKSLNETNYSFNLIKKLRREISKYDIVHVHLFPTLYWVAIASIGLKNTKLVYTEHSTSNRRRNKFYFKPIERFIYSFYSRIISISKQTEQALIEWLSPRNKTPFVVINNGVDIDLYAQKENIIKNNQIIMVSRFVPAKDQETLIKAMSYVNKDLSLALVGDGENLERCKSLSIELGIDKRVKFLGSCSNVNELLWQSLIGVQSSHWEGFGLTAVEMMAAGLPVIASNVEGLKQVVEGAGVLFKQNDEKELAQEINKLYENIEYRNLVIEKCINRSKDYSISKTVQEITDVYNNL